MRRSSAGASFVEALEARAYLAGNVLLVVRGLGSTGAFVQEMTPEGVEVRRLAIASDPFEAAGGIPRDVAVDAAGRPHLFNGTTTPALTTFTGGQWEHRTLTDWNTNTGDEHGAVAALGNFVYALDEPAPNDQRGIIRFTADGSASPAPLRFGTDTNYRDLAAGADGLLYALASNTLVDVYDPATMLRTRRVTLPGNSTLAITADAQGRIYGAGLSFYRYSATGAQQLTVPTGLGSTFVTDLEIDADGRLLAGTNSNKWLLTDTDFAPISTFTLGNASTRTSMVAFGSLPQAGGLVTGAVWRDLDGDGNRDPADGPLSTPVTVYADLDGDGARQPSEPARQTTVVNGTYSITLEPGAYTLRVDTAGGRQVTSPAAGGGHPVTVIAGVRTTPRDFGVTADATPPAIVSAAFVPSGAAPAVRVRFTEDVSASLTAAAATARDVRPGGATVTATAVRFDPASNTATFDFAPLPDTNYEFVLASGGVSDASGNPMGADFTLPFFIYAGDANGDRSVDFNDLVPLAQNYNTAAGRTWADGDFTGDGAVDFNDLVVLAQRYNTSLPPPPAAVMSSFSTAAAIPREVAPAPREDQGTPFSIKKPAPAKPKPVARRNFR